MAVNSGSYDPRTGAPIEDEEEKKPFIPGTSGAFGADQIREEFEPDAFDWAEMVGSNIAREMAAWAEANNQSMDFIGLIYGRHAGGMFDAINNQLFGPAQGRRMDSGARVEPGTVSSLGASYYMETTEGINAMLDFARNWMSARTGFDLSKFAGAGASGGRGRGSGRGSSGPTAADIRNQYDLEELTNSINEMSRGLVFREAPGAKKMARQYVDAIVKTKGEKKIDFVTFVRGKLEDTARFKSIYSNKPESMTAEQYMAPYFQSAIQMASPDEAEDIAIGGAQFGASPEQFRQRLMRTSSTTSSAPYISALEGRMQELKGVLKG